MFPLLIATMGYTFQLDEPTSITFAGTIVPSTQASSSSAGSTLIAGGLIAAATLSPLQLGLPDVWQDDDDDGE